MAYLASAKSSPRSHLSAAPEEEAVRHPHDVRLVNSGHSTAVVLLCILEGVFGHPRGSLSRDELDALDDPVDDLMLDARVLALCILADGDHVHVVIEGFVAGDETGNYSS